MATRTMTRKERYMATFNGEKPDRLPLHVGSHDAFVRHYYGVTAEQLVEDPEASARTTIQFVEEFGFCSVLPGVAYILFSGCGPEVGVRWQFVEDSLPASVEGCINSLEDLERWQIPTEPTGYFKRYLEICRIVRNEIGDHVFLNALITSPFTIMCFLRGIEQTLIDTKVDLGLYRAGMSKCVEHARFLGEQVLALGLPNNILIDIFLVPTLISASFYHQHIAPYNAQVLRHFSARGQTVADTYAPLMGKQNDPVSQQEARQVFSAFFGTAERVDVLRMGMKYPVPGYPPLVALSGRMVVLWPKDEILEFLRRALDLVVGALGKYPCVSVVTAQPMDRESALDLADKLRSIDRFLDGYRL
ncbi:MAG: hypothetical protein HY331_13805 [Chloroflexi bacterium]|nr:hypothetical protein [Chloroflexota bacterium]